MGLLRNRAGCDAELQPRDTFGAGAALVLSAALRGRWGLRADLTFGKPFGGVQCGCAFLLS